MGLAGSKVSDRVLAEKLKKRKQQGGGDEEEELEQQVELRRKNSLAAAIEDYMEGRVPDNLTPQPEEETKLGPDDEKPYINPRAAALEALVDAVACGDYRAFRQEVINHMASINKRFEGAKWEQNTLLHVACREGYIRMVEYELDPASHSMFEVTEVEMDPLNLKKRTPLHLAFTPPQHTYCGKRFGLAGGKARSEKPPGLDSAVDWDKPGGAEERERIVAQLLKYEADPNKLDFLEYSPLHYACMLGWKDTAQALLDKGADYNHTNALGQNCLLLAVKYLHVDIVEMILEGFPMRINHRDNAGDTALLYAVRVEHLQMVDLLLDFGADVTIMNYNKETPLKVACQLNNKDLVNIVLDFQDGRDEKSLALLTGEAREAITARLEEEKVQAKKREEAKRALQEAARKAVMPDKPQRSASGQWVPYKDKRGRGIFYYNKVSRVSQWEMPPDYEKSKLQVVKEATFGMSFYH